MAAQLGGIDPIGDTPGPLVQPLEQDRGVPDALQALGAGNSVELGDDPVEAFTELAVGKFA
jgi:hypothetical protein